MVRRGGAVFGGATGGGTGGGGAWADDGAGASDGVGEDCVSRGTSGEPASADSVSRGTSAGGASSCRSPPNRSPFGGCTMDSSRSHIFPV